MKIPATLPEKHLLEVTIHAKRMERSSEQKRLDRLKERLEKLTGNKLSGSALPSARSA